MVFSKRLYKILTIYLVGITAIFYLIWQLLDIALPEANINLLNALSTAFGIEVPDNIMDNALDGRMIGIILLLSVLSVGLILLHVYFEATMTAHMINPEINIITSSRGALSYKWFSGVPYVLIRLSNFHKNELMDVKVDAVLTVEETRDIGNGQTEQFLCYLPIPDVTPKNVLVMKPRAPWSIAIHGDCRLSNSLTKDYHFKPGEPILHSFSTGKKLVGAKRHIEVMISGIEPKSYARFVQHRCIAIDEMNGDTYTLHLHAGEFKSLPMHVLSADDLERFA